MLTETQKRVARAQAMLDSGMDAREVARECGYKNVNGMMGAIALHGHRNTEEEQSHAERREPMQAKRTADSSEANGIGGTISEPHPSRPAPSHLPLTGEGLRGEEPSCTGRDGNGIGRTLSPKANPSIMVETGSVRLQYNEETDSVMLTISGNPRFFWIGRHDKAALQMMRSLRDAASAMMVLLEDKKNG